MLQDTITIDHQLLEQLQQDPRYAYAIEEDKPSVVSELFDRLMRWWGETLHEIDIDERVIHLLLILLLLLLVWWLLRNKALRSLFVRSLRGGDETAEAIEENIHVIDFDAELAKALAQGNYTLASRLLYLHTLKHLSDEHRIDWQPQKTPTQYARELTADAERRDAFKELTNHFIRLRYGGFEADQQLYATMSSLQQTAEKGGKA